MSAGSDPIGASPGALGPVDDNNLKNDYDSIPDQSLDAIAARTQPREIPTGVSRGTQTVMHTDGSYMTIGLIPDNSGDFGIAFFTAAGKLISKSTSTTDYKYDTNGNLIFKNNGQTQYVYDRRTNKNIMQIGLLPDGNYGWAVARSGYDVSEGITGVS